ncbi:WGxxGxxG family protein [Paenibacillus sp. LX16]|uniref:WGxxGxxG family protein n=1 Tax=Paenibacillus sp. LX16 TaxID=1740264 RepID=UPI001A0EEAAC|nr:WGxxGxxG family protein [Paenibacillus sp. LX16]KAF6631787.1 WGxxGxxG-CTERM domain-containing protein [Paenibacillus sp. EKM208P]
MLKKMKIMVVVALMISSFGAAVAFAKNGETNMGTNDNGRTQMLTTNNDDDNDNWGWLGLLGLIGLAGLKRREPENHKKR